MIWLRLSDLRLSFCNLLLLFFVQRTEHLRQRDLDGLQLNQEGVGWCALSRLLVDLLLRLEPIRRQNGFFVLGLLILAYVLRDTAELLLVVQIGAERRRVAALLLDARARGLFGRLLPGGGFVQHSHILALGQMGGGGLWLLIVLTV